MKKTLLILTPCGGSPEEVIVMLSGLVGGEPRERLGERMLESLLSLSGVTCASRTQEAFQLPKVRRES